MKRKKLKAIVYGAPGTRKSTLAASFPGPILVLAFDPFDKATPHLQRGVASELTYDGTAGFAFQEVFNKKDGSLLTRVEYYYDEDPRTPVGYNRFLSRATALTQECREGKWATVVIDSITFMELLARKLYQYRLAANTSEPRQWYAGSTELVEELVLMRAPWWDANVLVIAHIDSEKDEVLGTFVHNPSMPGRMRTKAASGYLELWRCYAEVNDAGVVEYKLQTQANGQYAATSNIKAPDGCPLDYEFLWSTAV